MEKDTVLLPGMAEPEPTEKSPLAPPAFPGGQPPARYNQIQGSLASANLYRHKH